MRDLQLAVGGNIETLVAGELARLRYGVDDLAGGAGGGAADGEIMQAGDVDLAGGDAIRIGYASDDVGVGRTQGVACDATGDGRCPMIQEQA